VTCYSRNERVCSGNGFLPKKKNQADLQDDLETAIRNQNLNIVGWRDVPDDFKSWTNQPKKNPIINKCLLVRMD
jgi:glutamate synthase domain-containing protein 1